MTKLESPTLSEFLTYLAGDSWWSDAILSWPPDVFALVCSVLRRSGAYTEIVNEWRPNGKTEWCDEVSRIGLEWRTSCTRRRKKPTEVVTWWKILVTRKTERIDEIGNNRQLLYALLKLLAAADEASYGIGIVPLADSFRRQAHDLLRERSTVCKRISPFRARVLPKMHTPQTGITIRSLSHHLALCPPGEIEPQWQLMATDIGEAYGRAESLNLLILPWPQVVEPTQFTVVNSTRLDTLPEAYGFFSYEPRSEGDFRRRLRQVLLNAAETTGRIDGVILPELALTEKAHKVARKVVTDHPAFLISGVYGAPARDGGYGRNYVALDFPVGPARTPLIQQKHHRWRLDKSQVVQYGLGGTLNPRRYWWEHTRVGERDLIFVCLREWLTLCALICEDLARQDPVSEIVRSVGPNLVIAILMDGPQLPDRWPARYATVLADDPGSSVLTLTSLGMAQLCRPPGVPNDPQKARTVGLWKDAKSPTQTIELPDGAAGVVLNLAVDYVEEYSADGRSDHAVTGYPLLAGKHPIFI